MKTHWWRRTMLYRLYMRMKAYVAYFLAGKPGKKMLYIGITGTDGKSTTSYMTYHILKQTGYKVGIISTVFLDIGKGIIDNDSKMTSLDHKEFRSYIHQAEQAGYTHMVLEVSSHALYQSRVWPIKFSAVGFTNLTREHLDFHWTMEHYAQTKSQLFAEVLPGATGVVAKEFAYRPILDQVSKVEYLSSFGYDRESNIFVTDIQQSPLLHFKLHYEGQIYNITTKILGSFNAENMMVATVLSHAVGCDMKDIVRGLESFSGLPGRQEMVLTQEGVSVMIDFALTPDALSTLYTSVRSMGYRRLIAVFGATGTRDQGKRPEMGRVATELCDLVVITEDENYSEDGLKIMKQIAGGIDISKKEKYMLIQERTEAIRYAVSIAQPGDIVIVTGMANFATRAMEEGYIPWNERATVEEAMRLANLQLN